MKSILSLLLILSICASVPAQNWPSFRGERASGVADGQNPPTTWDAEKSTNILWKRRIPGVGHSSPVVWGDRIFVTTAITSDPNSVYLDGPTHSGESSADLSKHSWRVYCLDKTSGRVLWEKTAAEGAPKAKRHLKGSQANSTPATDGKHVVAFFASEGLYCYDFAGKLLWKQDLGLLDGGWTPDPESHFGFASSPVIHKHVVIVQCDTQKNSFIAAYDLKDGKRVWHTPREEDTAWSTPTIYEGRGRAELLVSGTNFFRGYDPMTGKELWRLADGADVKIPTPVVAEDLVFLGGGSTQAKLFFYAVRLGASGDISLGKEAESSERVVWRNRARPHIITPIVYGGYLYVCTDNGVLTQYEAKTGKRTYLERLGGKGGSFSASPVAADGRLYFSSEDGEVFVIRAGSAYELLATNRVGEVLMATPAISTGMIILRGRNHVFGIKAR